MTWAFNVLTPPVSTAIRIKDLPDSERPRERLAANGAEALRNAELIAILLRTGMKGFSAIQIAEQLLQKFGSLENLARASLLDLQKTKGIGRDKAIALKSAFTLAQRMALELRTESPIMDNPERIADLLREDCRLYDVEHFYVVLLNARKKLISIEQVSRGTLNGVSIHARDVFKAAISANAASIVVVHNHPSGDPTPSSADIQITRDLVRAGQLLKIEVDDHVILGKRSTERSKDYASLRELGFFYA